MRIIGYSYEADWHCIGCTQRRFSVGTSETSEHQRDDEHDVPVDAKDREGNPIHPVFSIDELPCDLSDADGGYSPVVCGDCGATIKER